MNPSHTSAALSAVASLSLLLGACAGQPAAAPKFDPQSDARAQAAQFIADNGKTKYMSGIRKLAVTGCNVLFAETSSASAGTSSGIFGEVGVSRAEAKVRVLYTLDGISDEQMQRFADEICANAEQRLAKAGFEVVPTAQLLADDAFKELLASGRKSPFEYKTPGKGTRTTYKVFAPTGYTVYDPRYVGTAAGFGQAFKAAAGSASWQHEGRVMKHFDASAVTLNILIDFAELQGSGQAKAIGLFDQNKAEVQHGVNLGITGQVEFKPNDQLKCWERFGKQECILNGAVAPVYTSKMPVTTSERFYKDVVNATTTGDKVAAGVTKALSMVAALGGVSGVSSSDVTRYTVEVEPAQFTKVSRDGVNGFLDMVFVTANAR